MVSHRSSLPLMANPTSDPEGELGLAGIRPQVH
jgi:hypothetical protein